MATKALPKIEFAAISEKIQSQFRGLNPNDPASWPIIPRLAVCIALMIGIVVVLWFVWLSGSSDALASEQQKELTLREDYRKKLAQAVNLDALKKQREQVQQYVTQLEKQLPSKAEMDALLSDINQAGLGRSLYFEHFKPKSVSVKEYYAELPIDLKVTGRFHDIGSFTADIAHLSRIVTLNNLLIQPTREKDREGMLSLEAVAKTFRYLDKDEVAAQAKAGASAPGAKK